MHSVKAGEWQSCDSDKLYGTSKPILFTPSLSHGAVSESWRAEWGLGIPSTWRQGGASKVHVSRHRTDVLRRCPGACVGLGLVGEKADPLGQGHPAAGWTPGPDSW